MKRTAAFLTALLLLFSFCGCAHNEKSTGISPLYNVQPAEKGTALSGSELVNVASNESFSLSIKPDTGYFEVKDLKDGYIYSSYPADIDTVQSYNQSAVDAAKSTLNIEYGDKINRINASAASFSDSINAGGYTVYQAENGFIEYYTFPNISVTVPVRITLTESGINAQVLTGEIEEKSDYIITKISLLSHFGAGGFKQEGYMIVPDGSGAVIDFSNGKHTYPALSLSVYGEDVTLGEPDLSGTGVYMPIFGIVKENHSILGIITKGDADSFINAAVSGSADTYNRAYPSFTVRNEAIVGVGTTSVGYSNKNFTIYDENEISVNALEVEYKLFSGDDADYSSMAKSYGEYLFEGDKINSSSKSLLYLNGVCSVNVEQNILGVTTKKAVPTASFSGLSGFVDSLYDKGVLSAKLRIEAWSKSDIKNSISKTAEPLKALGDESQLLSLSQKLSKNNGALYGAVDIFKIESSNKYGVRQINKRVLSVYNINKNTREYDTNGDKLSILSPLQFYNTAEKLINGLCEFKTGISLETKENQLYSDFGSEYARRQRSLLELERVYALANESGCAVGEVKPNAYAAKYLDAAFWLGGTYAHSDLEDYPIPFYQLAVSGYLGYSYEPLNLSVSSNESFLKTLEYGAGLMYTVIIENASEISVSDNTELYNCEAEKLLPLIAENYKKAEEFYATVGNELISHTRLAQNVYLSEYTHAGVVFNYTDSDFVYEGQSVKANSFLVIESGVVE